MKKTTHGQPSWVLNLQALMTERKLNPRSLSLKAGLNATAVRDMLEGRTRFPRYDTVLALSKALGVAPSMLMSGKPGKSGAFSADGQVQDDDLELLTEVITRLHETIDEYRNPVEARDFAAMATTLYRRLRDSGTPRNIRAHIEGRVFDLLEYESLRRRKAR